MASFDVTLKNAKFLALPSAQKIQIVKGETITVDLNDFSGEHRWTSFYDRLLELDEKPNSVKVKALEVGSTEVQVQTPNNRNIAAYLSIEIIDSIPEQAENLGGSVTVRDKT